ncbi:expressed unknown protein [Seminavis robusta]|uniref:Uncharacterized protein n=1 Tax=Seminavis robusta TaxID=568900 RepID=A0A9N8HKU7_9STRA|nr:expressed unknown protein [Seminavis robusta]|eukprot:Sro866_g212940.1 n/a (787) ;mRNA; f:873-3233
MTHNDDNNNAPPPPAAAARAASMSSVGRASNSQSSNSSGYTTPSPGNPHFRRASSTSSGGSFRGGLFPPPTYPATRRTSSGSRTPPPPSASTRAASAGLPTVVHHDDMDDQTALSSIVASTTEEGFAPFSRFPLGVLEEADNTGMNMATGHNNSEFACLSAAAQLAQESNMGNMIETTRSAPNPYESGAGGTGMHVPPSRGDPNSNWDDMEIAFQNLMSPSSQLALEIHQLQPKPNGGNRMDHSATTPCEQPPCRTRAAGDNVNFEPISHQCPPPPPMNDYTRMQQTLGMTDLPAPPGSTSATQSVASIGGMSQQSASQASSSAAPPRSTLSMPSSSSTDQGPACSPTKNTNNTKLPASSSSTNNGDPTAEEQYQIWKQIQEELERKEMELALQLSTANDGSNNNNAGNGTASGGTSGGGGGGSASYPCQNPKPPTAESGSGGGANGEEEIDEEEALKVALRISEEEANAATNNDNDNEEDEIARALRLSEEQAEEDRRRLQQLQEQAGEMSEEEQLRLAIEQSMQQDAQSSATPGSFRQEDQNDDGGVDEEMRRALAESLQQPHQQNQSLPQHVENEIESTNVGDDDGMDEDMRLALRLSQQMEEEERRLRDGFAPQEPQIPPEHLSDGRADSFRDHMQAFPGHEMSSSRAPASMDDSGTMPPIRPTQAPTSPGLNQPMRNQQQADRPVSRWKNRLMGGSNHDNDHPMDPLDIPDSIPPHHPSREDIQELSLSQHQKQNAYLQNYKATQGGGRVHAPDDGNDMPPVSRPQRRGQQQHWPPSDPGG